jgi:nicotinamide phosphoribosyltransferase
MKWFLQDYWNQYFFLKRPIEVFPYLNSRMEACLGKGQVNMKPWHALHALGYLPIEIKALPEGSRVNLRVPLMTIRNTHPDFFWVTNYLETAISAELWKSVTTATTAYEYRRMIDKYAEETGADPEFSQWQGHDFSYRGQDSIFGGASSGAAHLLSFTGTDTIPAIDYAEEFYNARGLIGGSVPATEHSVMSMAGEAGEQELYKKLITETYPTGIVSIVSDTYDFWNTLNKTARELKNEIMQRNGKVVFRPDSGDPEKIILGDPEATPGCPEYIGAVELLWNIFGGTKTAKGYSQLDSHVGVIYGDSITLDRAQRILEGLKRKGFASSNIVFGIGSFTYQHCTRDTLGCAMKATAGVVDGELREIFKKPKTDDGTKHSAQGLLRVEQDLNNNFVLYDRQTPDEEKEGMLETVFLDGKLFEQEDFKTIRNRLGVIKS